MKAVALTLENEGVFETIGTVDRISEGFLEVRSSTGTFRASRAFSCLLAPEVGDVVLLAGPRDRGLYVLAVLERPGCGAARLSTEGDLSIEVRSGRLAVSAAEGLDFVSRKAISIASDRLEARAREGSLFFGSVRLIAGAVDSAFERLRQTVRHAFRTVQEIDHLRAGQIDYSAEGNLRLHGENTLMTARELVKADAKQIHVG
ncbi:MAG TPA: DUF3540 domain-containing protein [Geobacteraceae bacterium]|nr:DUF3540 domain-containing protein [Geobacteraceae bacterium]